jgi:hypothetical protein
MKIYPDTQTAAALFSMAHTSLQRLQETNVSRYPSNSLVDYYDIIHKLMESVGMINGMKFKGDGAHLQLIDYVCRSCQLSESMRVFLQELRVYRNRINYEGFVVQKSYIMENEKFFKKIIAQLSTIIKYGLEKR